MSTDASSCYARNGVFPAHRHLTSVPPGGIVIAIKPLRISAPFRLELGLRFVLFSDLTEVIPAKPASAGAADGFDLQNVMGMKTKVLRRTTGKGVETVCPNCSRMEPATIRLSHFALFGKQQSHFAGLAEAGSSQLHTPSITPVDSRRAMHSRVLIRFQPLLGKDLRSDGGIRTSLTSRRNRERAGSVSSGYRRSRTRRFVRHRRPIPNRS